jgi:hypothetical protein
MPGEYWTQLFSGNNTRDLREYVQDAEQDLEIKSLEDWERLPVVQARKLKGWAWLSSQVKLRQILKIVYPDREWGTQKRQKRSSQNKLRAQLAELFPNTGSSDIYVYKISK